MRIGIDVRYLTHGLVGGVHTYVANLVPALISAAAEHEIILYGDQKSLLELADLPANVKVRLLPYRNGLSSIANDLRMNSVIAADHVDVMHFPANYGFGPQNARTVITLHDEINIMPWLEIVRGHRKNIRTLGMMTYLHLCTRAAIRQAALILTVSEYSRRQIIHYGGIDPHRIVAAHSAPNAEMCRIENPQILAETRRRYGLEKPFVLADALKNPGVLVRAWERLPEDLRRSREIVFFSRRPDPLPVVRQAVAAGSARLLINPPRADLIALYSMAEAFVFLSWIEGFGLPALEAMNCGAPVIASDRGSLPEVVGPAGAILDAEDDAALAQELVKLFTYPEEVEIRRQAGYAWAQRFSWEATAKSTLQGYKHALAG